MSEKTYKIMVTVSLPVHVTLEARWFSDGSKMMEIVRVVGYHALNVTPRDIEKLGFDALEALDEALEAVAGPPPVPRRTE